MVHQQVTGTADENQLTRQEFFFSCSGSICHWRQWSEVSTPIYMKSGEYSLPFPEVAKADRLNTASLLLIWVWE